MRAFEYLKPKTLEDAATALREEGSKALAGGMSLIPTLKLRLAAPTRLVDLAALERLRGVRVGDKEIEIGAMATHASIAEHPEIRSAAPALALIAAHIGDPHVRHRGTIGGSIANSDPAACWPAGVLGFGATLVTDRREIPADRFFRGLFETALEPGEILTAIRFPRVERAGYVKFPQPASRFALVGVCVVQRAGQARVAVTGAGACAFRATALEERLARTFSPDALEGIVIDADGLNEDLHASAEYRAHLVGVIARRAVAQARA